MKKVKFDQSGLQGFACECAKVESVKVNKEEEIES